MKGNPESERFVQVAQAEDPFTADALEAVLKAAGMAVLRTDHPGGSGVENLGTGWALPWFELSVLEEHVARARELVEVERRRLVETAPEAERAAEDEERETEGSSPP
jgi:Putative prokaryotic signal transducing protein